MLGLTSPETREIAGLAVERITLAAAVIDGDEREGSIVSLMCTVLLSTVILLGNLLIIIDF